MFAEQEMEDGEPRQRELLLGVLSAPSNVDLREAARGTWARIGPRKRFRHYFLIGAAGDAAVNARVEDEARAKGDIFVCRDTAEHYHNLSRKVLAFVDHAVATARAIRRHPANRFRWIFKMDDDTFVRIDRLLQVLDGLPATGVYWGCSHGAYWPHRSGKWAVSEEDFPDSRAPGPPFLCGPGYALSADVAEFISRRYERHPDYRPFPLEDVGTALLVADMGIRPIHSPRVLCMGGTSADFVATHYVDARLHRVLAAGEIDKDQ